MSKKAKTTKKPKPASTPDHRVLDVHLRVLVSAPMYGSRKTGAGVNFDLVEDRGFWERALWPSRDRVAYSDPQLTLVGLGEIKEVDEFSEEVK